MAPSRWSFGDFCGENQGHEAFVMHYCESGFKVLENPKCIVGLNPSESPQARFFGTRPPLNDLAALSLLCWQEETGEGHLTGLRP